jgi:hypothetical protein
MDIHSPFSHDLLTVWEEYRKAAKRARQLKSQVNRSRLIALTLIIGGAVMGVLADQSASWTSSPQLPKAFALISAVVLAIAAFLSRHVLDSQYERLWVFTRSQAEALKSEAYIYLVKAPPYHCPDRDERLSEKAQEILGEVTQPVALNEEEKRKNLPQNWLSMEDYIKERVTEQINGYYEPKSLECDKILTRLWRAGFYLGITGAILGGISSAMADAIWPAAWIAVIGTITGALAAFTFAGRYQYLMTSYTITSRRLKWLRNEWYRLPEEEKSEKFGDFVHKFEDAISIENSSWVAEWKEKTDAQNAEKNI